MDDRTSEIEKALAGPPEEVFDFSSRTPANSGDELEDLLAQVAEFHVSTDDIESSVTRVYEIASSLGVHEIFRRIIEKDLERLGYNEDDIGWAMYCFTEAYQNAFEYGNGGDVSNPKFVSDQPIKFSYTATKDSISFRVQDQGVGKDIATKPSELQLPDKDAFGGRGLASVKIYCPDLAIIKEENTVTFTYHKGTDARLFPTD